MKSHRRFFASRKIKAVCVAGAWCAVVAFLPACASRSQFQKGYERGASDTVKRQYWILQDMQKRSEPKPERRVSLYRIPITPDPEAAVKTVPYEISIPVVQ
ncbi:MAG: hypothetical protein J0I10_22810 [Verrucomicrobia bacterium]|nr:hypothetical protein [Verrucomicrobiota bacterium]